MLVYPIAVPSVMQGALIGASGTDPTIPYSPGWSRRLWSALWATARRNQRQSPQAPCSTTSCPATT